MLYHAGRGLEKDIQQGVDWIKKSAELGYPDAQLLLGFIYLEGEYGEKKDEGKAKKWVQKAANQGLADAENGLGYMYLYGKGVPKDYTKAKLWLEKAAEQGESSAQVRLGIIYWKGLGVDVNYDRAEYFLRLALDSDNEYARSNLDKLYQKKSFMESKDIKTVTASVFNREYNENEIRANQKYKSGPIYITGRVDTVGMSLTDKPVINFFSNQGILPGLRATFSDDDMEYLADLNTNDIVSFICYGKVSVILGTDIKDCYIGANIRKRMEQDGDLVGLIKE